MEIEPWNNVLRENIERMAEMNIGFRRPEDFTFQEKRSTTLLHFQTVQKYVIMCAIPAECQVVLEGGHTEGSPKMSVSSALHSI